MEKSEDKSREWRRKKKPKQLQPASAVTESSEIIIKNAIIENKYNFY